MSDLKKIRPTGAVSIESGSNSNNSNITTDNINNEHTRLNIEAPTFERVLRADNNIEEEKVCRICLDDDRPETMIAPCRCKGGSKWVHRECLDEWRAVEKDRAFSRCTECQFEYHLQPIYQEEDSSDDDACRVCAPCSNTCTPQRRRRFLFCWLVSRDALVWILLQQLVVVLLGAIVSECDPDREIPTLLLGGSASASLSPVARMWLYYGMGWFAFLVVLGLYGCVAMCRNRCNFRRAIDIELGPPQRLPLRLPTTHGSSSSSNNNSESHPSYGYREIPTDREPSQPYSSTSAEYYRRARRRRHHYYYYGYDPVWYPMYYPSPGGGGDCCCCWCPSHSSGRSRSFRPSGSDGGGISSSTSGGGSSSGGSGDNDGAHILLLILLVIAIVLAIIGFVVGVLVAVVVGQRIVKRHVHLLQKRQLVREFQVMDLREYDLDRPVPSAPTETTSSGSVIDSTTDGSESLEVELTGTYHPPPPPSAPVMPEEDVQYLQKLGLMDR